MSALRLVAARPSPTAPLAVCYLVGPAVDAALRAALPSCGIVATGEAPLAPTRADLDAALAVAGAPRGAPLVLVGYSAGCQPVRAHLLAGVDPLGVVTADGTHAGMPPGAWQIEVWRVLAAEARRGEVCWAASCTQMDYVERIKAGQKGRATSTRHVLEAALGLELPAGLELHEGGLHVYSDPSPGEPTAEAHAAHVRQQTHRLPVLLAHVEQWLQARAPTVPPGPATEPAPPPWRDPALSLGARCLLWCENELAAGVQEEPAGSNTGPRIREYFAPAMRDGRRLGLKKGAWCVVAQCAALEACLLPGEPRPHSYVVSGVELEQSARDAGTWRDAGGYEPRPGDLAVMRREGSGSDDDRDASGWFRHVPRVRDWRDVWNWTTLGANEANGWRRSLHTGGIGLVVGWVAYPRATATATPSPELAELLAGPERLRDDVAAGREGLDALPAGDG